MKQKLSDRYKSVTPQHKDVIPVLLDGTVAFSPVSVGARGDAAAL